MTTVQLTTGQVASKLGISVRTLRYYDSIKLFSPKSKKTGGRRIYSEEDLLRLEKITLLKSLSLPLSEIQNLLDELSIKQILEAHQKHLRAQVAQLQESLEHTTALLNLYGIEGELRWDTLLPLVRGPQKEVKPWQSYFNEDELRLLTTRLPKLESNDEITQQWINVIVRIERCLHEGIGPHSEEGAQIAREIEGLSALTFAGDRELMEKFWNVRKDPASSDPGSGLVPIRSEVIQFVEDCMTPS
ncbi:MerR family transcriptional regulator [Paenibacillus sp. SC116]|uniref:MerR family transcriptional regulator n=1 Tax=Paenibacillus sp. SC116 TaxID=2968986 RepID=UPI00215B008D|nr:MerR family transcriptional regulator [Paenibacillus sp. SC116]MCR8843539.1 MerR family transcriptional regulator [Paenibacillus sp. SC116]